MSAAIWPPIGEDDLVKEQADSQARELEWLLVQLREKLQSLKAGLEDCAALLAPSENGSTLVLSSLRSESLKGLITRIGTRITKGVWCYLPLENFSMLIYLLRTSSYASQACRRRVDLQRTTLPSPQHRKHPHWSFLSSHRFEHQSTAVSMSST